MEKNLILASLNNKKIKDYSFTILFFLMFTFFVIFVIRPNLITVFRSQKELVDLNETDKNYENIIFNIINLQSVLQANLDDLPLLDQSLPSTPQVNKIIDDLQNAASESGIIFQRMDISKINLKEDANKRDMKSYSIDLATSAQFPQVYSFIKTFMNQRRLKTIDKLQINTVQKESTSSSVLNISLQIDGFYL